MKYYTLTAQVLAKIVFFNLLPKLGEYSHAQGSAPLLIYYLLKGIRVNIPKLIVLHGLRTSSDPKPVLTLWDAHHSPPKATKI